jgi:hypothetical protein
MPIEMLLIAMTICTGYVIAGLLTSMYQLVFNAPASLVKVPAGLLGRIIQALMIAFGTPVIIVRNAVRGRILEQRPVGFVVATTVIASFWSYASGLLILKSIGM